jgi:hypothetical protein
MHSIKLRVLVKVQQATAPCKDKARKHAHSTTEGSASRQEQ